ncbi:hypothetical protein [Micrococcus terreus]|uniref:hypothetical protein n=1 Tax=Micrococcus terreus TaxID=574650 RepID=UPI00254EF339|nr:hypothetical protein [Micrococcus terreus]MDK7701517.1 hypothetical protein [Micrococcus terreus]WOO98217.1 hypothetical protein R3I42_03480 [Micrococcus terreus]
MATLSAGTRLQLGAEGVAGKMIYIAGTALLDGLATRDSLELRLISSVANGEECRMRIPSSTLVSLTYTAEDTLLSDDLSGELENARARAQEEGVVILEFTTGLHPTG